MTFLVPLCTRYILRAPLGGDCVRWREDGFVELCLPRPSTVLLAGPTSLEVGQTGGFVATHLGSEVHSHQFFVDDEPVTLPSMNRYLDWTPEEVGLFEIPVMVDDGVSIATTSLFVEVSEVP